MTARLARAVTPGPGIAGIAAAVADPSRAAMLDVLLDGEPHPIGALARRVGIGAPTASSHLRRLVGAGLVVAVDHGRERRVRLAGADVAELLERLAVLGSASQRGELTAIDRLRYARTCYDHLAGHVAIAIVERLIESGWLFRTSDNLEPSSQLLEWLAGRGHAVSPDARRPLARACIDWTERVPHLAGRAGTALAKLALNDRWFERVRGSRGLRVTARGRRALASELDVALR